VPDLAPDAASVPTEVEAFARAAAAALGLAIDDEWWPGVVRHLGVMLSRAAAVECFHLELPEDAAPVYLP
jgi:hypothetical protein